MLSAQKKRDFGEGATRETHGLSVVNSFIQSFFTPDQLLFCKDTHTHTHTHTHTLLHQTVLHRSNGNIDVQKHSMEVSACCPSYLNLVPNHATGFQTCRISWDSCFLPSNR